LIEEVEVKPGEMNRYVELKDPGGSYFVEVAQKTASGRVFVYSRSNKVVTSTGWFPQIKGADYDVPAVFLEYFAEEIGADPSTLRGISSAEAHNRAEALWRKGKGYFASRF